MSVIEHSNQLRLSLIDSVRRDLIGPANKDPYMDHYKEELELPVDVDELFVQYDPMDTPSKRYVAGKLFSWHTVVEKEKKAKEKAAEQNEEDADEGSISDKKIPTNKSDSEATGDDPILQANAQDRSAFGMTFRVPKDGRVTVLMCCAIYVKQADKLKLLERGPDGTLCRTEKEAEWWTRKPLEFEWETSWDGEAKKEVKEGDHVVEFILTKRRQPKDDVVTITLTATNKTPVKDASGAEFLYQCELEVTTNRAFNPLQERVHRQRDEDQQLMDLLYRKNTLFAMGHGCAVTWHRDGKDGEVTMLRTDFLPVHSIPAVVAKESSEKLDLAMWNLSQASDAEIFRLLESLIAEYETWVTGTLEPDAAELDEAYRDAAERNINECKKTAARMRVGLQLLSADANALQCFRWMNHAMLWQQQRSKVKQRDWVEGGIDPVPEGERGGAENSFRSLQDYSDASHRNGRWRPFQLAFVLMNLPSMWDPVEYSTDRDMVDLIWFPTGGGKTEAYLGLTAFTMFARRMRNEGDDRFGTAILMRYTLRLLTTQQFERASSLIMACELTRRENLGALGRTPFSIGLWVGSDNTPMTNKDAVDAYTDRDYRFALLKCPCCGARFGTRELRDRTRRIELKGVAQHDGEIIFRCFNQDCETRTLPNNGQLPIYVVNDQIYAKNPTMLVGTVDMFAQIPWKSQKNDHELISRIFGFRDDEGLSRIKPPELIIQDELHLISGPLGSMVGMYETLIQELCTDHGTRKYPFHPTDGAVGSTPPKIVASSATITRAVDQVRGLYGKTGDHALQIFPPQGLDIGETWFSRVDKEPLSREHPHLHKHGRWYVGMCPSTTGQSTVYRTYGSVLARHYQEKLGDADSDRSKALDYYSTLIGFYNSTKELGRSNTMMAPGGNMPSYLITKAARELIPGLDAVNPRTTELYSMNSAQEINERLKMLERADEVDACLATNMIATGLDVPRLGLMFIHGQPKTTAEYIQASSRVGRSTTAGPGLVFMHYSGLKPRDLSIFEHFSSYHERIYAQVEPTSVTSYSIRVREKALHAIIYGMVRHYSLECRHRPGAVENDLRVYIKQLITDRARIVLESDEAALAEMDAWMERLVRDMANLEYYGDMGNGTLQRVDRWKLTAMMAATDPKDIGEADRTYCLSTPNTMRSVDQSANIGIINQL